MKDIPIRYDPQKKEEEIYAAWSRENLFHADEDTARTPYAIVIPPPNITGILHMGHALNNTIQDILIRWKRMEGFETLWMPGTDHAGIATQNVVERELAGEGLKREEIGREKFLEKIWQWKEEYGSTIIRQLKRLGCSCDWERTRFTMDGGLSMAVREVFGRLYSDGLIYKGGYIINWCPRCATALSDEEAEHREVEGMLYYIKYPVMGRDKLEKENEDYLVVATTRPETMLGDVAVAVNPKDPRYSGLEGKTLVLPIIKRELRIIFDEDVDPEFGTGALKVTPAHDPVDFELGARHGLESINVMHPDGRINALGGDYKGMDRFECREAIVEDLKQRKLFIKTEKHVHAVGHCYRCHTVVEPRLSKQWFVKMKPLAIEAIKVVKEGRITFYPSRWTKVYLNWMENIRPWCISRQIWWGHRIPVWYCRDCLKYENVRDVDVKGPGKRGVCVSMEKPDKCPVCGGTDMEQDPDVLDTWFSSWLWPFSTLGWPEDTGELRTFYPTDALVTAQEIIFFWVARMIMAGLRFREDIPFRDVYIHGTVRDTTGTKMSKSLGNVIDPLDIIREVGSDALRFSIISITSQGQDVFLSKEKFELGRNFANKLWNASRYVLMNLEGSAPDEEISEGDLTLADRWILSSFNRTAEKVTKSLKAYRFNDAASALYDFIWHKYCDWYLELSKFSGSKGATQKILVKVLKGFLRLLHPFMPFITEEIWQKIPGEKHKWIMTASWPGPEKKYDNAKAAGDMEKLIGVITAVRNVRAFWNIGHAAGIDVLLNVKGREDRELLEENVRYIEQMARCSVRGIEKDIPRPDRSVAALVEGIRLFVPLGGAVDIEKERTRVNKKIEDLQRYLNGIDKKLKNKAFVEKAPEDVVRKEEARRQKFDEQVKTLKDNLGALK
ncbi:MAG: valine--tRNA ligase [Candidatus Makaraimicrobium thalassicum]|nr:MAG: valine--tRNA ligase [Candidatus Omnitrophota bacterium]